MSNAPVVIFVYKRLIHTKKMLLSLNRCLECEKSDLYIFSDGNKKEDDKEEVLSVRRYIREYKNVSKFKSVTIIEQEKNNGLAYSIIQGVSNIITQYGKIIVVEDDLMVSEDFLVFMNQALNYYENNDRIWSISGYTPNLFAINKLNEDVYFHYRGFPWGWATWLDRWKLVDWNVSDYHKFRYSIPMRKKFCRGGNDLPSMLKAQKKGKIDSWYVRWTYEESKRNMLTVYPKESKVVNLGLDNTGVHCKESDKIKFDTQLYNCHSPKEYKLCDVDINNEVLKEFNDLYKLSIKIRIRDKVSEIIKYLKKNVVSG